MALTNAERQQRHRKKLRAKVRSNTDDAQVLRLKKQLSLIERTVDRMSGAGAARLSPGEILLGYLKDDTPARIAFALAVLLEGPREHWSEGTVNEYKRIVGHSKALLDECKDEVRLQKAVNG